MTVYRFLMTECEWKNMCENVSLLIILSKFLPEKNDSKNTFGGHIQGVPLIHKNARKCQTS